MRSAERGARNAECGTRNAECGVRNAECGARNAERGMKTKTKYCLLPFCLLPLLVGCASIEGKRLPDGTMVIRSTRIFWSSQKVDFSVYDGTNIVVTLRAAASGSDKETMAAITDAAVTAAVKGVTK